MNEKLQKPLMLIVDDVEINRVILAQFFKDDYEICEASNGEEALLFVEDHPVSVILLDLVMPIMDGFELMTRLKRDDRFRDIPVIVTTARNESDNEVRAMELGAADFISKPYNPTIVRSRVQNVVSRLENEWRKLEQSAQSKAMFDMRRRIEADSLTGLYNRAKCERIFEVLDRRDSKYAIVSIDMNGLKKVNDSHGHSVGDKLLIRYAEVFKKAFNGVGTTIRMGGDEFLAIVRSEHLHELQSALKDLKILEKSNSYGLPVPLEAAYGYAIHELGDPAKANDVYKLADSKMYDMKVSTMKNRKN